MKKTDTSKGQSAAALIAEKIAELGDSRGESLGTTRELIKEANPDAVEK